jgi:hypothetical protein
MNFKKSAFAEGGQSVPLSDTAIAITSLWRHGYLSACLAGIAKNLPEVSVIVADDSDTDICSNIAGSDCIKMEFDSGLSAKRNAIVKACTKPMILLACDDVDFSTSQARQGVEKLVEVLDRYPEIDVAGGRVNNKCYEGFLEYSSDFIREHLLNSYDCCTENFVSVDITVNYFLARTEILRRFPWPKEMKIGGEHVCLFLDLKLAGRKVVWVPGVNIDTLHLGTGSDVQDPRYREFRKRAIDLGHPLMKKRYNISSYIGFNGEKS